MSKIRIKQIEEFLVNNPSQGDYLSYNTLTEKFENHQNNTNNAKIANSLEYIKNFMNSKDDSHLLPQLKNYLEGTDRYRNQNFFESYPQFRDIFTICK